MRLFLVSIALAAAIFFTANAANAALTFNISPISFDFGDVALGGSGMTQRVNVTNVSDAPQTINIAGGAAGTFGGSQNCQGNTLAPGASCFIQYNFSPSTLGAATATTNGSINGQEFNFSFTGNGIDAFLITPTALDFGSVALGSTSVGQQVKVINTSNASQTINIAGGAAGLFGGSQNCQGNTLAPGGSCFIQYAFTPMANGAATGSTNGSINGQAFNFTFTGTGGSGDTSPFFVAERAFDFGNVAVGDTSPQQEVVVKNVSDSNQTINVAGGAAGLFGGSQNCQGNTLVPGASCSIVYSFTPDVLGEAAASTSFSLNGYDFGVGFEGYGISPFLISATGFDFGEVELGSTSAYQVVDIYNVSNTARLINIAGGAGGVFGGAQNCQGATLDPGAHCFVEYGFTPTGAGLVNGTTNFSINGFGQTISFRGIGVDAAGDGGSGAVPEPASWMMMVIGFGALGAATRARRRPTHLSSNGATA